LYVCLKNGRFVEEGTHDQLIDKEGAYYEMWQEQFPDESEQGVDHLLKMRQVFNIGDLRKRSKMENRVQSGYTVNSKVSGGIVNEYILQLEERLEQLDPGCRLLKYRIPEEGQYARTSEPERCPEHEVTLVDGVLQNHL
jgi:hypothetical protein